MADIPEQDWKKLRSYEKEVLNLACQRILDKATIIIGNNYNTPHERYLELFSLIYDEDKSIGWMFDDLRRSTAIMQLSLWRKNGLLTEEQFKSFTPETRKRIDR